MVMISSLKSFGVGEREPIGPAPPGGWQPGGPFGLRIGGVLRMQSRSQRLGRLAFRLAATWFRIKSSDCWQLVQAGGAVGPCVSSCLKPLKVVAIPRRPFLGYHGFYRLEMKPWRPAMTMLKAGEGDLFSELPQVLLATLAGAQGQLMPMMPAHMSVSSVTAMGPDGEMHTSLRKVVTQTSQDGSQHLASVECKDGDCARSERAEAEVRRCVVAWI